MKKNFLEGWKCTDADNHQYCLKHSEDVFTYKEFIKFNEDKGEFNELPEDITREIWEDSGLWTSETIDFNKLTNYEIHEAIESYYENVPEVVRIYGDDWKQIVVECYFEQEFAGY